MNEEVAGHYGHQRHRRQVRHRQLVNTAPPKSSVDEFIKAVRAVVGQGRAAIIVAATCVLIEVFAIALHFYAMESVDCRLVKPFSLTNMPEPPAFVMLHGAIGLYSIVQLLVFVATTPYRRDLLLSFYTVAALLTGVPGIIGLAQVTLGGGVPATTINITSDGLLATSGAVMNSSTASIPSNTSNAEMTDSYPTGYVWTPTFLRVWPLYMILRYFIMDYTSVHKAVKEIGVVVLLLTSLIVTCMGGFQFAEAATRGCPLPTSAVWYFIMVTVTTVGYGDLAPSGSSGRAITIFIIFMAFFFVPILLSKLQFLGEYLASQNGYTGAFDHVVVCGTFSLQDVSSMLAELLSPSSALCVVLVSEEPFDALVLQYLRDPRFRQRVTCCVSDVLKKNEMFRFRVRDADAVFLLSPKSSVAQRGDYETMMRSVAFNRHDSSATQLIMLKRGMHIGAMKRNADVLFHREQIVHILMGMALKLHGFIPFYVNLVRREELVLDEPDENSSWWDLYQYGRTSRVATIPLPPVLEARLFSSVVLTLFLRMGITVLGFVRQGRSRTEVVLGQMHVKVQAGDKLIAIARQDDEDFASAFEDEAWRTGRNMCPISTGYKELLRDQVALAQSDNPNAASTLMISSPVLSSTAAPGQTANGSGAAGGKGGGLHGYHKRAKRNVYPFRDHIVLIDLASTLSEHEYNQEEVLESIDFQIEDLLNLLRHVLHDPTQIVVLLSRRLLPEKFADHWPSNMRPIYQVRGCGVDDRELRHCAVGSSAGVVVFSSIEGTSSVIDANSMLVLNMVHAQLCAVGREKTVPVILQLDNVNLLHLGEPHNKSMVNDEEVLGQAALNYSNSSAFIVGRAIASTMTDTTIYQCFFNEFLPVVVNELILKPRPYGEMVILSEQVRLFLPPLHRASPQNFVFADIVRFAVSMNRIPLGLYRIIDSDIRGDGLIGYRFFYTCPHPNTQLRDTDIVYYVAIPQTS